MTRHYRRDGDSLVLQLYIQPGASRSEFAGLHGERLKVRIKAAPVDGKANRQLLTFIAEQFGVSKSAVSIVRGEGSRHKTVQVTRPLKISADSLIN